MLPIGSKRKPGLGIAFSASEPRCKIGDPFIRPKPERRQRRGVDQTVMPAGTTFDDDEIPGLEIANAGRIERDHRLSRSLFVRAERTPGRGEASIPM